MAIRIADFDEGRVSAYVEMFGLSVPEEEVRELTEAVRGCSRACPGCGDTTWRLWIRRSSFPRRGDGR